MRGRITDGPALFHCSTVLTVCTLTGQLPLPLDRLLSCVLACFLLLLLLMLPTLPCTQRALLPYFLSILPCSDGRSLAHSTHSLTDCLSSASCRLPHGLLRCFFTFSNGLDGNLLVIGSVNSGSLPSSPFPFPTPRPFHRICGSPRTIDGVGLLPRFFSNDNRQTCIGANCLCFPAFCTSGSLASLATQSRLRPQHVATIFYRVSTPASVSSCFDIAIFCNRHPAVIGLLCSNLYRFI